MFPDFRRERDTDRRDRGGGESSSMCSTSEERERYLFPVFTTFDGVLCVLGDCLLLSDPDSDSC